MPTSDVTVTIRDVSTKQILDLDSGLGEANPDRVYVPLTAAFTAGDIVWVVDDDGGEFGTIQSVAVNDYLDLTANLAALYEVADNAAVYLIHVVSNYVKDTDINKNKNTGIGSCTLVLNNDADAWGGTFTPNDAVNVSINGALMFVGFVDDVVPYMDKRGVLTNELTVKCRDHGRYLTDYHNTAKYEYQESGAIIDKILAAVGDPLLYTDPTGTPSTKYECQRTYLSDSIIDIAQIVGWDFYIDTNGRLQYFLTGSVDSGVDLLSVAGEPTNNLLSFEEYENIGTDIKNIVEIHAGSTKDHWTEGGSADWTTLIGAGSTITDETTVFIYGVSSIKFVSADTEEVVGLNFTTGAAPDYLYSQGGSIDMSSFCQATVAFIPEALSTGSYSFNPTLIDTGGNVIYFTRNQEGQSSKGFTQQIDASVFTWHLLSFPIGEHTGNEIQVNPKSGYWYGDVAFDWTVVAKIGFRLVSSNAATMDTVYIDALYIPNVEAKSITRNAVSIAAYGTRMISEYRKELHSQIELDSASAKRLRYYKDPVQKFKAVAIGQTGTKYASQAVDVQAPSYGIAALTDYIIASLHHKLHYNVDVRGWDYITEYDLVASDTDAARIIYTDNPMEKWLQELRKQNRGFKGSQTDDESYYGDWMTGTTPQVNTGAAFPTDVNNGDLYFLTTDYNDGNQYYGPALYKYVEATTTWIRDPMVMYRAAQPPGGGEMTGDIYYNTATDIIYQWSGGAWVKIGIHNISDADDFGTVEWPTDQLAIEVRPWTGNLNIVWDDKDDDPPTDWNHLKWGLKGFENATDAQIKYADGTVVDVNFDQNVAVGDGFWFVYWDEAHMTGGDYDLQWSTTYSDASGVGKGIVASVEVEDGFSPSVLMYSTYTPTLGVGSLVAHSIFSKHISADWITGKNFRTAAGVGAALGPAGLRFDANGIAGYSGGTTKTAEMDASTGYFIAYGNVAGGSFRLNVGAANYGWITSFLDGADEVAEFRGDDQIWLNVGGDTVTFTQGGDVVFDDDFDAIIPATNGGVDLGTTLIRFGSILGNIVKGYTNLRMPAVTSDPASLVDGDIWLRTDL